MKGLWLFVALVLAGHPVQVFGHKLLNAGETATFCRGLAHLEPSVGRLVLRPRINFGRAEPLRESRIIRRLLMASMENDKVVYLTQEGLNRLQAELEVLRNKRRPEVAERIRQAKEFGDINENAEYDDAKNEQGFVEGRILLLEKLVRNASIIEGKHVKGVVEVGSTVKVHDEYGDEAFTIVGSAEAEPSKGRISLESPVGKALLGKRVGDDVSVLTPAGSTKMLIVEVR